MPPQTRPRSISMVGFTRCSLRCCAKPGVLGRFVRLHTDFAAPAKSNLLDKQTQPITRRSFFLHIKDDVRKRRESREFLCVGSSRFALLRSELSGILLYVFNTALSFLRF